MSATLAAALYQDYFGVPEPPIKVGARRFPVKEVYLEDICNIVTLPKKESKNVTALLKGCMEMKCTRTPSMGHMEKLYSVVASLATVIGEPGSSVLVFVPGMNDSKSALLVLGFKSPRKKALTRRSFVQLLPLQK